MTGQFIKVTSSPYHAVRLTQNARLISSSSIDMERRKAIARMKAFQSRNASAGSDDVSFVNKINRTFSVNAPHKNAAPASTSSENPFSEVSQSTASKVVSDLPKANIDMPVSTFSDNVDTWSAPAVASSVPSETASAYTMDRGSFEFRVATGDIAFIPSFTMTIITQRPEVHIEYTGGFRYVPPQDPEDVSLSLSI